jgi:putative membrane protein
VPATWPLDPAVVIGVASAGVVYVRAHARVRAYRPAAHPAARRRSFLAGLFVIVVALQTPIDTWSQTSFAVHMLQHLLLTMVAAPLLVLGAPIRLALGAWPGPPRRRLVRFLQSRAVRVLSHPVLGWAAFFAVIWGTHVSGIYDATLRSTAIHTGEHLAYLATALMFWSPVAGVDPSPSRLSHPGRILYLFLAMPAMAFLGLAIYSARGVLYPSYAVVEGVRRAIADQHAAGAVMWTGTMFLIVPALAFVLMDWMRSDERDAARDDARLAESRPRSRIVEEARP